MDIHPNPGPVNSSFNFNDLRFTHSASSLLAFNWSSRSGGSSSFSLWNSHLNRIRENVFALCGSGLFSGSSNSCYQDLTVGISNANNVPRGV